MDNLAWPRTANSFEPLPQVVDPSGRDRELHHDVELIGLVDSHHYPAVSLYPQADSRAPVTGDSHSSAGAETFIESVLPIVAILGEQKKSPL